MHIVSSKENISYVVIPVNMLIFKTQGILWDLSMMRMRYIIDEKDNKA